MKKLLYILFLIPLLGFSQTYKWVTVSGAGAHNGTNEANAYSLSEAKAVSTPSHYFHVKAGNYGSGQHTFTSGTWVGYKTTPGDIVASEGSTFDYGDTVSASEMPLLDATGTGIGISLSGNNITFKNFQVKEYSIGLLATGTGIVLDNIISVDMGTQNNYNAYDGFGIRMTNCTNAVITNIYVENATAEAFKIWGGTNNIASYVEIRADNTGNPTDYYSLMSNTTYCTIEYAHVERAAGLAHGGHGLTMKWNVQNSTYRYSTIKYTNIDLNFEDVYNNEIHDIRMIGQSTSSAHWHTNIDTRNGAHDNVFRNIYATDIYNLITWTDDNDGFQPSPDTDAVKCGYNNSYVNMVVVNVDIVFIALGNTGIGGSRSAPATGNKIINSTIINYGKIGTFYNDNSGNELRNVAFYNHTGSVGINWTDSKGDNMTKTNLNFDGTLNHSNYGGTTLSSGFVGTGSGVAPYRLTSGSALKDAGASTDFLLDYDGTLWGTKGIGAFEYSAGGGDVTAPSEASYTVANITESGATITGWFSENTKARIEWGTSGSYGNLTAKENSFITPHQQSITTAPSNTLIYWRWAELEDATGNTSNGPQHTFTTLAGPDPEPEEPLWMNGVKSRFLKMKNF